MKKTILMVACFFAAVTAYGQDNVKLPSVVPPSPTVASLMSLEDVPVAYYTGQPNISIPIFSKGINKDLTLSIGLQYTTTGVMIDNRSGWTGTGWALQTGGVISRTVRGIPDEEKKQGHNRTGVLNNPDFWNYISLNANQKDEFNWKAKGSSADRYDTELDLYQFNLLGVSGRFVVVNENGILKAKLISKSQNVKIDLTYNSSNFEISSFVVTDALGYKYTFDITEIMTSTAIYGNVAQGNDVGNINGNQTQNIVTNISAWHLRKIETSNNIELVSFAYSNHTHTYETSNSRTTNTLLTSFNSNVLNNGYNSGIFKPAVATANYAVSAATKKPSVITFKDGTSVHFSTTTNHPETFGAVLNSIAIKDNSPTPQTNKTFNFTYQTTDRLWLTKVSEVGGSLILNHELEYNDKANLPGYNSAKDNWGYNGGSTTSIQKGLLKKVHYPTGGNKEFVFEQNTFGYERNQIFAQQAALTGGVRIKQIKFNNDASTQTPSKEINYYYNDPSSSGPNYISSRSSGAVDSKLGGKVHEYNVTLTQSIFPYATSSSNGAGPYPTQIQYQVREELTDIKMTQSSYVGYKYVTIAEQNNGRTVHEYTTAFDFPSSDVAFTYPFHPVENVDYKRGYLKTQKIYNNSNVILKEKINTYVDAPTVTIAPSLKVFDPGTCGYMQFYNNYANYIASSPDYGDPSNWNPYNITTNCGVPSPLYFVKDDLKAVWRQLTETISKDYYYNAGTQIVESRKTFAYNPQNYQVSTTHTYVEEGGQQQDYKMESFYPVGTSIPSGEFTTTELSKVSGMAAINKINIPVYVKTYKNGNVLGDVKSTFNNFYTNVYELDEVRTSKVNDPDEEVVLYHGYYNNGNFKEVSKKDGTHVVYIWGYNETLPVAKIENATFADIPTSIYNDIISASNADTSASAENTLRTKLANLRNHANFANSLVTTFTYDPLIGVTSITDPRGQSVYYHYDSLNRLEFVKDAYGKILSKNEYNYKN